MGVAICFPKAIDYYFDNKRRHNMHKLLQMLKPHITAVVQYTPVIDIAVICAQNQQLMKCGY